MGEYNTFDHFARDLFLHSLHFQMQLSENETYDTIRFTEDASLVLLLFADGHCELFYPIFENAKKEVLQTDEQFLKFAIPRCLNLIDNDRYFYSIMLVASFLQELVIFLMYSRVCYRFYFTAYKCLAAVFKRTFENSFESNGGWNGFRKYLKDVIKSYDLTEKKLIISALNDDDSFLCKRVDDLIKHCDDISDDFNLNEYETSLLMDDDVKDIEESLEYNEADVDPLHLTWPPLEDGEVTITVTESQSSNDHNAGKNMNESSSSSEFNAETDMARTSQAPIYPKSGKDMESSLPSNDLNGEKNMESSLTSNDLNGKKNVESSVPSDDLNGKKNVESSLPSNDLNGKKNVDDSKEDKYNDCHSILKEAIPRLSAKQYFEKIKLRTCPCCEIKCYQFSYKLFTKQLASALTDKDQEL